MNSVGSIVKLVIGFSLFVLCTPFALVCAGEYTQAKDIIETLSIQQEEPIEEEFNFIAGRSQIDNPTEFNNMCTTGRYNYNTDLVTGAMSFYKDTGIQLYFLSFDFGKEKFETEELLRFQIKNELSSNISIGVPIGDDKLKIIAKGGYLDITNSANIHPAAPSYAKRLGSA